MNNLVTPREKQVLDLYGLGFAQKEIADTLSISAGTVDTHLKNAKRKMGLQKAGEISCAVMYKKYSLPLCDLPALLRKRIAAALLVLSVMGLVIDADFLRVLRQMRTGATKTTRMQRTRRGGRRNDTFILKVA